MKIRFSILTIGLVLLALTLPSARVFAEHNYLPPLQEESPTSTPLPSAPSPAQIIDAVNMLRLQHGLDPLMVHDVLMQVAAEQASALAASDGAVGHQHPLLYVAWTAIATDAISAVGRSLTGWLSL